MLSRTLLLCKTSAARRAHHAITLGSRNILTVFSSLSLDDDSTSLSYSSPLSHIQRRTFAGRKDRASTAFETRKPTKKQRKEYHRRQRKQRYEVEKHAVPNSKARERRAEKREHDERLIEIGLEEERLKGQLSLYFDKVREIQANIEASDKFQALLQDGKTDPKEIKKAAREAAKKAAEKEGVHHPPLPSWVEDRLTYDWGDALIDDLMGNSADLTSTPSPSPVYMGKEYGRLRRKVERVLRLNAEERLLLEGSTSSSASESSPTHGDTLLTDRLISDLIRSHRDANGKRTIPIGLGPSLEHLFQDVNIPRSELGIHAYTSLLTVCQNPWEARKVDEMRQIDGIRSNEYFWSALVDVYARSGDYLGAERVLDEMLEETKREYELDMVVYDKLSKNRPNTQLEKPIAIPPLPAYTSFFASCYKLVARNDVHPSIKSDAANRAWSRWKEMRIHSVAPDEMAYGAIMRIFAAQGRAEKAVDLLEEIINQMMMPVSSESVFNSNGNLEEVLRSEDGDGDGWYDDRDGKRVRVKPTTLLFTSALKSVSKSHEIACRFSGGTSRKSRKRESITAHHGRLARKIVILAEQAEVEQDDGFVSALMLCAATAGDSSTARAIYLASKVRRLDHLRTCGGKDHLKKLQGLISEEDKLRIGQGGSNGLAHSQTFVPAPKTIEEEISENHKDYENREYGNDTRVLSALLLAHSKAMQPKGLGSMWAGKYNRGYLCENSLRYIEAYNIPQMKNQAIPGITSVEAGLTAEGWEAEDFDTDTKQLRKKNKFRVQQIADDGEGNRIDDMDEMFAGWDPDPDEIRNDDVQLLSEGPEDTRDWLSRLPGEPPNQNIIVSNSDISSATNESDFDDSDDDLMSLEEKLAKARSELRDDDDEFNRVFEESMRQLSAANFENDQDTASGDDDNLDGLIDEDEFNRLMEDTMKGMDGIDDDEEDIRKIPGVATNDYESFRAHIEEELREEGSGQVVSEEDTRQLFDMMRAQFVDSSSIQDADFSENEGRKIDGHHSPSFISNDDYNSASVPRVTNIPNNQYGDHMQPQMQAELAATGSFNSTMHADDFLEMMSSNEHEANWKNESSLTSVNESALTANSAESSIQMALQRERNLAAQEDAHITELKELLPGLPLNRIKKISDEFASVLGYPSVMKLALALRENMPDSFGPQCLTRKNLANAKHLYDEALNSDIVDAHILNAMLQVYTNSGRIEPAIRFYETEFQNRKLVSSLAVD
jgi:pentatricopeptide repeat protein